MKKLFFGLIMLVSCFFVTNVFATPDPVNMLKTISDRMINDLKTNKAQLKDNDQLVYSLVRKNILPSVNAIYMAQVTLGRKAWMSATKPQLQDYTNELTKVVVRTYGSALSSYTDEVMRFYPIPSSSYEGKNSVIVKSLIIRSKGPSVPVTYRLALQNGAWVIIDLSVEGVSVVNSFRSQIQSKLMKNKVCRKSPPN